MGTQAVHEDVFISLQFTYLMENDAFEFITWVILQINEVQNEVRWFKQEETLILKSTRVY
jgi:hypothetical protein